MDGKTCPKCEHSIGASQFYNSFIPSNVTCPSCKASISYGAKHWYAILVAILCFIPVILSVKYLLEGLSPILFLLAVAVTWLPFEYLISLYLRKYGTLKLITNAPRGL